MTQYKNIAIFGGTFDPIHNGHLLVAEQVYNQYPLDHIIFMPAGQPPHKIEKELTSSEQRLKMVNLAIDKNDHFYSSSYELKKEGKSYTAETLRYFCKQKMIEKIFFIIGADSLLDLFNWREPEYLLRNAFFIVADRPGYEINKFYQYERYKPYIDKINIMDAIQVDISSTRIRQSIQNKKSIRYQTPDVVIKYINDNNLYRS